MLAGILRRLVDTVEDEARGEGTDGDVETALYGFRSTVSFVKSRTRYYYPVYNGTQRIGFLIGIKEANSVKPKRENRTITTENTYTDALVHWLGVGSVRSESSRLLVPQERPHRGHRSPGEEHDCRKDGEGAERNTIGSNAERQQKILVMTPFVFAIRR